MRSAPDWNYPVALGRHRGGRRRRWPHQERHRHRQLCSPTASATRSACHSPKTRFMKIPVARDLVIQAEAQPWNRTRSRSNNNRNLSYDPFRFERRKTSPIKVQGSRPIGGDSFVDPDCASPKRSRGAFAKEGDAGRTSARIDRRRSSGYLKSIHGILPTIQKLKEATTPQFITVQDGLDLPTIKAFRLLASELGICIRFCKGSHRRRPRPRMPTGSVPR